MSSDGPFFYSDRLEFRFTRRTRQCLIKIRVSAFLAQIMAQTATAAQAEVSHGIVGDRLFYSNPSP
jgi:hypothetical protein